MLPSRPAAGLVLIVSQDDRQAVDARKRWHERHQRHRRHRLDDAATDVSITIDTTFTGKGSDAVCNYAKDLQATDFGGDSTSATDLKASFTKIEDVLNNIKDKAPDEIKADVETMFTGYQKLIDLYKKYDYDTEKMVAAAANDPDLAAQFASISSPEITAATARVSAYFSNVCGLTETTG